MNSTPLIECVPNFSEGRDHKVIMEIVSAISSVEGVQVLNVDPGHGANRTVITFVGTPSAVVKAAFLAIQKASILIDMSKQSGTHPRLGATDVCPLIPLRNISLEEVVPYACQLGKRVGEELGIPVYLYESAASSPERKNLATIRAGEYEGLAKKIKKPEWIPDFGPASFHRQAGATVIGARDFLIAYNVNLNTTSVDLAKAIALDIRERGQIKRNSSGEILRDQNGRALRIPGSCKSVKAIGWYIEEYGKAQVSMNLMNYRISSLHDVFEACKKSAENRGVQVTGSELIGMAPLEVFLEAGRFYLKNKPSRREVTNEKLIEVAIKSLGLEDLVTFDPYQKIIEYRMAQGFGKAFEV